MGKVFSFLIGMFHLTLSFDGWSSKGHDEIYTVHITTPSRRSFLVDGLVLTGLSTTGDMIFECLSKVRTCLYLLPALTLYWGGLLKYSQVIIYYTARAFSAVVSDTTKNVKKTRRLICEQWPWILNIPDPCHQLNLMAKDVMLGSKKYPKIHAFSQVSQMIFLLYFQWLNHP